MTPRIKKTLILGLVVPASLLWYWFSFLAITIYGHAFMGGVQMYYLVALVLLACSFITVAIYTAIKYPKVSKISVYVCGFGSSFLTVGLISGMNQEPVMLAASVSLIIATLFFIVEHLKDAKSKLQDPPE